LFGFKVSGVMRSSRTTQPDCRTCTRGISMVKEAVGLLGPTSVLITLGAQSAQPG
jgi:hypothetical protein